METATYLVIDVVQHWKIIVAGLSSSGRKRFIDAINEITYVSATYDPKSRLEQLKEHERLRQLGRTFYLGRRTLAEDLVLYLFTTPNSQDFDVMFPFLTMNDILGYVILVDSSNPSTFAETQKLAKILQVYNPLPYVIAANKQDLPNALSPDTVKYALALPDDVPVIPCVATDKESVKRVLLALLEKVLEGIEAET